MAMNETRSERMNIATDRVIALELADLNNEGAYQLSRGQVVEAAAVFEAAMYHVRTVLQLVDEEEGHSMEVTNILKGDEEDKETTTSSSSSMVVGSSTSSQQQQSPMIPPCRDHNITSSMAATSSNTAATTKTASSTRRTTTNREKGGGSSKKSVSQSSMSSSSSRKHRQRRTILPSNNLRQKRTDMDRNDDEDNCNDYFLYDKPMRVKDRYEVPKTHEMCLYVTYNLALTLHLSVAAAAAAATDDDTCCDGSSSSNTIYPKKKQRLTKMERTILKRALNLYKLVYSLQLHWETLFSESHELALWNNMAHIFKLLHREELAQTSLQHLLSTIMYTVVNGRGEYVDQLDSMLLNVWHLIFINNQEESESGAVSPTTTSSGGRGSRSSSSSTKKPVIVAVAA